jgi:hypothetical protein
MISVIGSAWCPSSELPYTLEKLKHKRSTGKIIDIYRNFDGKLLHSYFTTVSDVFVGANSSKSNDYIAI